MKIQFCGAAGTVTGSCYLIEVAGSRVLVDCGVFQGKSEIERRNKTFPFPPKSLSRVVLTHAHMDHIGRVPQLVKEGYRGPILATKATVDLVPIMLMDSARVQAEDARHGEEPLYTEDDVRQTALQLKTCAGWGKREEIAPGVSATFYRAGHLFGSASIVFDVAENGRRQTICFSGDIGRPRPIIAPPDPPKGSEVLIIESTYGDRDHKGDADTEEEMARVLHEALLDGGNILVPAFALGRTQELVYTLNKLAMKGRLPRGLEVFVDSPLANQVTEVVRSNPQIYNDEAKNLVASGDDPFDFRGLHYLHTVEESKRLNDRRGGALIIASSGMCTAGRILHHLKNHIHRKETDVIFVGFQAEGSLGRRLIDGAKEIRIRGETIPVRGRIHTINGLSGHAGRSELLAWARVAATPSTRTLVTHGEPGPATSLAALLEAEVGTKPEVPQYLDTVDL